MTINLTQAQKLQELGVKVKSLKVWGVMNEDYREKPRIADTWTDTGIYDNTYSAYNAEELIKLLRSKEHHPIDIYSHGDGFMFHNDGSEIAGQDDIYGDSLTECLANELIYMLENGVITAEEINGNSL